jgi:WD40-like Beta Propeller Repeat
VLSRTERRRLSERRAFACAGVLILLFAATLDAATRYDPRLRFRTISTPRFDIHFHQGEESLARRLATIVEEAAAEVDRSVGPGVGRVQVILVDQTDVSNGWATPLPYNTIEITAAAPPAESTIGNTDDWLRLVFTHEYAHIAHLSRARGWIGGLRRGLGRQPLLFPNLYQPIWGIEGIATWEESASTRQGRVPAGDFRLLLQRAAAANRFEPLDRANGGNVDWPSGAIPYVYGAYFHQYLAERYGAASLRTLADETSRRIPYLGSRAYRKVYGRSLGELWEDFEASAKKESAVRAAAATASSVTRLTRHGFAISGPRYGPAGSIFYSAASPHHFPALMELRSGTSTPRRVASRYGGNRIGVAGERLIVDELEVVKNVALKSDLFSIDPDTGKRRRVTRDARALDPDVAAERAAVVCTVQMSDRRAVAIFDLPRDGSVAVPQILISEPTTDFAAPRWSPEGRRIAAERRRLGGPSEIVLIDAVDRGVRVLASRPDGRSASPTWSPDGTHVLFSSADEGEPFRVYRVEVETGALTVLDNAGVSAQAPDVSRDGRMLVFVGYTPDGYDLFSMPLVDARWTPVSVSPRSESGPPPPPSAPGPSAVEGRPYSPWPTLVPRFWTPTVESDADEIVVGAATGSVDALGRHAYGIEAGWSTRSRPDWQIAYAYDRWWPTVFGAVSDDTDPWRDGEHRTKEADLGVLLPLSRVRFAHRTLASLHLSHETFDCLSCVPSVDVEQDVAALRFGWEFDNSRAFGYSISAEEGGRFSMTAEVPRSALGADGNGVSLTMDARRYWRVAPRHAVVALRAAAAGSWGDQETLRLFSAAGDGPQPGGFDFGLDAIGLLRGFDEDDVAGTRAATVNADYRVPLLRIDRGVGTVPIFFRSLHGAVFVDVGHAWMDTARWADVRTSIGAEISADTVLGFALPVTFSAGVAWRRDGDHGDRGFVTFVRIGRAF